VEHALSHPPSGGEQKLAIGDLPRHRHDAAYAALVLEGGYLEVGDTGRWRVEAGDVVAHRGFEAHANGVPRPGARVLNIALPPSAALPPVFRVADPDALIRAARRGDQGAVHALLQPQQVRTPLMLDWPDLLAAALRRAPVRIGAWAAAMRLDPATVSRGFRGAFGASPAGYRADLQTQDALRRIVGGAEPLAQVAQDAGFADQAHMSRSVRRLTGRPPSHWRRVKSVQDRRAHAAL